MTLSFWPNTALEPTPTTPGSFRCGFLVVPFCILIAASITPTAFKFWSSWSFIPAVFFAPAIFDFDRDSLATGLLLGVLPIFLVASIVFGVWTFILRRHDHVA